MSTKEVLKQDLRGLTTEDIEGALKLLGEPPHRARQIFSWVAGKGIEDPADMSNVPKALKEELKKKFYIGRLVSSEKLVSKDRTEKYLWELEDGEHVESVYLSGASRRTLCISTQVGCRIGCPFCCSGARGFTRNLTSAEIVSQVLEVQKLKKKRLTNLVYMGMGEPLDNYDNLVRSIKIINHPAGIGLGARKITVSTCGLAPEILKLKDLGIQIELSISLHASNNKLRNKLVPVNRRYPLKVLLDACEKYYTATGRVITLEYTVIKGMNDSENDIKDLAEIAKRLKAKVNLIGCSPSPSHDCASPGEEAVHAFEKRLSVLGAKVTVRRSKGSDILASCGQLAAKRSDK